MPRMLDLVRGFAGHPLHPPLTDVAIGAYTVGVVVLVLGALGVEEEPMAHGALLAISGGLLVTIPTAITGVLDWWQIPKGTPARTAATIHLVVMVLATLAFVLTWLLHRDGYEAGEVTSGAWIAGLAAELLLTAGGYLGGALAFVYGVRVIGDPETPLGRAVVPGAAEAAGADGGGGQAGEMATRRTR